MKLLYEEYFMGIEQSPTTPTGDLQNSMTAMYEVKGEQEL